MSLAATLLDTAVTIGKEGLESFDRRMANNATSIVQAFREHTNMLVDPAVIEGLKVSKRRPVEIPVFTRFAGTVGTVRQINPTPDEASTARVPINWGTKTFSFKVSESINEDNYKSLAATVQNTLWNELVAVFYNHANSLEKQLASFLEANKFANLPAVTVPNVDVVAGAYELNVDDFIINAPVIMQELFINGRLQDLSNFGAAARRRDIATYGRYNQRNLDQYNNEQDFYSSREIVVTPGSQETHFVMPAGSVGLLNIIESDARARREDKDGEFTVITDPWFGFDWGVYITKYRADQSATYGSGQERSIITRYDFAADFAPFMAYSSVAGESPIVKMEAIPS